MPHWLARKPLVITSLSWLSLGLRFMSLLKTMQRGSRFQDFTSLIEFDMQAVQYVDWSNELQAEDRA